MAQIGKWIKTIESEPAPELAPVIPKPASVPEPVKVPVKQEVR